MFLRCILLAHNITHNDNEQAKHCLEDSRCASLDLGEAGRGSSSSRRFPWAAVYGKLAADPLLGR
jgi:hypothetical protein